MSAKRFSDYVNANLVGKQIKRAFVHDNGCVRVVFSDSTCVEIGATRFTNPDGPLYFPVIEPAEPMPKDAK